MKSCRCNAGTPGVAKRDQCPNDPDAGIASECQSSIVGQRVSCIESVVCTPSGLILTSPPDMYGCGLTP